MKILSLNGGGTVIYLHSKILALFEEDTGVLRVGELFDRISGVSAGSIFGGLLASGCSASYVNNQARELCTELFGKRTLLSYMPWNPSYSTEKLNEILTRHFTTDTFADVDVDFSCHATDITETHRIKPTFWKSWDKANAKVMLRDAIQASSSAPTYFKPHSFGDATYIDGGLVTNNPTMCSIADALSAGEILPSIYVLNLQGGTMNGFKNAHKKDSLLDWATDIYKVGLYGVDRMVEYQAHELLKFNNHVILPNINLPLESLDFDTMDKMAQDLYVTHKEHLKKVLL